VAEVEYDYFQVLPCKNSKYTQKFSILWSSLGRAAMSLTPVFCACLGCRRAKKGTSPSPGGVMKLDVTAFQTILSFFSPFLVLGLAGRRPVTVPRVCFTFLRASTSDLRIPHSQDPSPPLEFFSSASGNPLPPPPPPFTQNQKTNPACVVFYRASTRRLGMARSLGKR